MERSQRRSFTDDCKRQAVDLLASSGRSIGSVANAAPNERPLGSFPSAREWNAAGDGPDADTDAFDGPAFEKGE
jgi:hypothetical protein